MTEIIITDVTRFKAGSDKLCVAGVTLDGSSCIRPMSSNGERTDYLTYAFCKEYNILPGVRVSGDFLAPRILHDPHNEDRVFKNLTVHGPSSSEEFETVLMRSLSTSVASGFGVRNAGKVITPDQNPIRSITTIQPQSGSVRIVRNRYQEDRVQISFSDQLGEEYSFLSITDLGLYDFVGNPKTRRMEVADMNALLDSTERIYLRVGMSRPYTSPDGRHGYWLQVNGVYSFPEYSEIIRSY